MWLSLALLAAQLDAGPAGAQGLLGVPNPSRAVALFRSPAVTGAGRPGARTYPATYYFEGAVIGAGVLGTTVALFAYEWACDESSNCDRTGRVVTGGVVGALLGGTVGALIGGAFPAPHPRPLRGHGAKAALLGAVVGAAWGFGLFSHFCLNGCSSGEVGLGAYTTTVGALAGLLVGR
jgi:hypothetical protein